MSPEFSIVHDIVCDNIDLNVDAKDWLCSSLLALCVGFMKLCDKTLFHTQPHVTLV